MGILDQLFGLGNANDLDDLLRRLKAGNTVMTADAMRQPQAPVTVAPDRPQVGMPYAPPTMQPADIGPRNAEAVLPQRAAPVQPQRYEVPMQTRIADFFAGLSGVARPDRTEAANVRNQTMEFLARRGISPEDAQALVANPALLKQVLPAMFGANSQTKLDVVEVYDDNGRKQKVVFDPRTGATRPLGGAFAGKPDERLSVGEKAVDRQFAKDYVAFATGGFADAKKNLDQLRLVHRELSDPNGPNLTGWFTGHLPDAVNSVINQKAVDRRELVEEVVQRNLRLILGAQFTQREGDRLIARAYNPTLDEKVNADRLGRLLAAMDQALTAKMAAADYYEKNGTLSGYKGPTQFSMSDFESAIDGGGSAKAESAPTAGFKVLGVR